MKNVYLVQPSNILSGEIFLPYAAGALASYAWQFESIKKEYTLKEIFFIKDPIESVVARMKDPYLVGFSSYMWNVDYNIQLAKEIKRIWPQSIIVFGGPEIPENTVYLEQYAFIDILIYGEGERPFYHILTADKQYSDIYNIAYRCCADIVVNAKKTYRDISDLPSPYASGVFDAIMSDERYSALRFDAVLETNRGCPYGCIYCYWAGTKKNFRLFSLDHVKKDLEWIAKNKIVYCICADSNFGILERDQQITDYLIALKKQYGYPLKFETSSAKNKDKEVFNINTKLQSVGLNCGISVAVQSFSEEVLKNIGRTNISLDRFADNMRAYRSVGISTYTDFILALPGETFDSFCRGIFLAIENGQHDSINVHPCEVLPNTVLFLPETRKKYSIETIQSIHYQDHSIFSERENYGSRSEIIVSTSTMSREEWRDAMRLSVCVQCFHSFGLLKYIAIYLRRAENTSFFDFYTAFYQWVQTESVIVRKMLDSVCKSIDTFLEGKSSLYYFNESFSDACLQYKEGLFLCAIQNLQSFFAETELFFSRYFHDDNVYCDLVNYQESIIKTPGIKAEKKLFRYDWIEFFSDMYSSMYKRPVDRETIVSFGGCEEKKLDDYIRNNIWYGKRENKMLRTVRYADQDA